MTLDNTIPVHDNGIALLEEVARRPENTTGLLFHGSPRVLNLLAPRPVYWKDPHGKLYNDSEVPVICASDKPFIATFMALVHHHADWKYDLPIGGRQPEMRSESAEIRPLYAIRVTHGDFENL